MNELDLGWGKVVGVQDDTRPNPQRVGGPSPQVVLVLGICGIEVVLVTGNFTHDLFDVLGRDEGQRTVIFLVDEQGNRFVFHQVIANKMEVSINNKPQLADKGAVGRLLIVGENFHFTIHVVLLLVPAEAGSSTAVRPEGHHFRDRQTLIPICPKLDIFYAESLWSSSSSVGLWVVDRRVGIGLCPFGQTMPIVQSHAKPIGTSTVEAVLAGSSSLDMVVETYLHSRSVRLATVRHLLPPFDFLDHGLDTRRNLGMACLKARVQKPVLGDEPGTIEQIFANGARLDRFGKEGRASRQMGRIPREDEVHCLLGEGFERELRLGKATVKKEFQEMASTRPNSLAILLGGGSTTHALQNGFNSYAGLLSDSFGKLGKDSCGLPLWDVCGDITGEK